ncbi:MAG: YfaZ family outer membrane protein [Gammaproteobacteria bacterium]
MRILNGLALLGLPLLAFILAPASAHEIDLSLNSGAFRVVYATPVGDGLRLEGGWLHDSDEGDLVHAGFLVTGDAAPGNQKVTAGVGARLAFLDADGSGREGYALGVGGSLRWVVPRYDRIAVSGEAYWAPNILSGGDAEGYIDSSIRVGYSVTRKAEVYVGARYAGADFDKRPSMLFDTGLHAGFNLRF